MSRLVFAPILALAGSLASPAMAQAQSDVEWRYQPERNAIGRIYYYERTNTDGSMDERVTVFRRDDKSVEVYKENGLCRPAALVKAKLDFETFSAPRIIGGKLLPGAQIEEFAFVEWDREAEKIDITVRLPNMEIRNEAPIEVNDWHLYDFDLASLTVMTPHLANPQAPFDFGLALVWADPSVDDPLTWMGEVVATPEGKESHLGRHTRHYSLSGSALEPVDGQSEAGEIWLDVDEGHIVDAIFPMPSHPGYVDLRLRLLSYSDVGETEWTALLNSHFEDCAE
jgi:hypothetical protein